MTRFPLLAACALALSAAGCMPPKLGLPAGPAAISDATKIDEQAALTVTLAYTAAARAAALAIETGLVKDRATIARIGALDRRAYAAVQAAERAYRAGNAASFAAALVDARAAIGILLSSVKGPSA